MRDLETLLNAFNAIGINFLIGRDEGTTFVFLVGEKKKASFSGCSPQEIYEALKHDNFFEFDEDGKISSY